jgi:hypothetical protein
VTIAQAIHLLDRLPLFEALATRMTRRARVAIVANGSPLWLRDLPWSLALSAYLGEWFGIAPRSACGTDTESRGRYRAELATAGFRTATEVTVDYRETHTFAAIVGSVTTRSALARGLGAVLPHDGHGTYDLDDVPAAVVARVAEHALGDQPELVASTTDVVFGH